MLPALLERLLERRRLQRGEPLQLGTVKQFSATACGTTEQRCRDRLSCFQLLQLGKLDPPAVDRVSIARVRRIVCDRLPSDGVSGPFDYSSNRIEQLID